MEQKIRYSHAAIIMLFTFFIISTRRASLKGSYLHWPNFKSVVQQQQQQLSKTSPPNTFNNLSYQSHKFINLIETCISYVQICLFALITKCILCIHYTYQHSKSDSYFLLLLPSVWNSAIKPRVNAIETQHDQ